MQRGVAAQPSSGGDDSQHTHTHTHGLEEQLQNRINPMQHNQSSAMKCKAAKPHKPHAPEGPELVIGFQNIELSGTTP